jgi:membrane-associated phospholipid phosphatase
MVRTRLKKISYFLFVAQLIFSDFSFSQTPYRLSSPGDFLTAGAVIPLNIAGNLSYHRIQPLTSEQISLLNRQSVCGFDRHSTYHYSLRAEKASDAFLYFSLATPLFLMADAEIRKDALVLGVMYFEIAGLTSAETQLIKAFVHRIRPFVYNENAPLSKKLKADAQASFFSGHSSMSAAAVLFTAAAYTSYYHKNQRTAIYLAASSIPLATGFLRYKAGKHFPTDIIAGLILGAANGLLISKLHETID